MANGTFDTGVPPRHDRKGMGSHVLNHEVVY